MVGECIGLDNLQVTVGVDDGTEYFVACAQANLHDSELEVTHAE